MQFFVRFAVWRDDICIYMYLTGEDKYERTDQIELLNEQLTRLYLNWYDLTDYIIFSLFFKL